MPALKPVVKTALSDRIKEIASKTDHKPFVVVALGLPYFVNFAVKGDVADVTAKLEGQNTNLTMQRDSDHWKVVAVNDDGLTQKLVDDVVKDLPAIGDVSQQPASRPGISPNPRPRRRR